MSKIVICYLKLFCLIFYCLSTEENEVCIFGSDPQCFYGCRCHFSKCNTRDPNCETCNHLTGLCLQVEEACAYDDFTSSLYEADYWTGKACQKGNIAQGKLYSVEGLFEFPPSNGGATDGTFNFVISTFISPYSHTLTLDLEGDHVVEFIDLFYKSELTLEELDTYAAVRLERQNGTISRCWLSQPSGTNVLQNGTNLEDKERMHFLCQPPSIGHHLKVQTLGTDDLTIPVTVYEVVVIGYKYAHINQAQCLNIEGDEDIQWCTQCNNSMPPECREPCDEGFVGINCLNETGPPENIPTSDTPLLIIVAVYVSVSVVVCTAIVMMMCNVYRAYIHGRADENTYNEPTTELEETYDELDDIAMAKVDCKRVEQRVSLTVMNDYQDANNILEFSKTENMHDDYLTQQTCDHQLKERLSTTMQAKVEPIPKVNLENDTDDHLLSLSSDYMHTKASENIQRSMEPWDNCKTPNCENVLSIKQHPKVPLKDIHCEEDNPYLQAKNIMGRADEPSKTSTVDGCDVTNNFNAEEDPYLMPKGRELPRVSPKNDMNNDLFGTMRANPSVKINEQNVNTGEELFSDDNGNSCLTSDNPYQQPVRDPACTYNTSSYDGHVQPQCAGNDKSEDNTQETIENEESLHISVTEKNGMVKDKDDATRP